jgi:hypothetical protein
MNKNNQQPKLRSNQDQSAGFLIWVVSVLYLLTMVWLLLLSPMGGYSPHDTQPQWLVPAVVIVTILYAILMLLRWPHEEGS